FSSRQLTLLDAAFRRNAYLVGRERAQLARQLGLSETQVKVWYQNRRTKDKRDKEKEPEPFLPVFGKRNFLPSLGLPSLSSGPLRGAPQEPYKFLLKDPCSVSGSHVTDTQLVQTPNAANQIAETCRIDSRLGQVSSKDNDTQGISAPGKTLSSLSVENLVPKKPTWQTTLSDGVNLAKTGTVQSPVTREGYTASLDLPHLGYTQAHQGSDELSRGNPQFTSSISPDRGTCNGKFFSPYAALAPSSCYSPLGMFKPPSTSFYSTVSSLPRAQLSSDVYSMSSPVYPNIPTPIRVELGGLEPGKWMSTS
ncbi:uncharacterized protein LOC108677789, partial [Hyalella azteca]|uniref:Uncharacterized protein LOC108677789 n=1 Tax=Hyalella azteca TaxID=294128 RepID=A0A8B7P6P9_HYAAZ